MKLGTHNSMSYLPPKKWYLYPFRFIAKCQKVDIATQYKLGARMFDLRVSFDKDGVPEFRHGSMAFKGNVEDTLKYLNNLHDKIHVRMALEVKNTTKDLVRQEALFVKFCSRIENEYINIKFFLGRRKFDWSLVYKFKTKDISYVQAVSSTNSKLIDDLWPWLYAIRHNKDSFKNRDKTKYLLLDFIEIQ